MFPNIPKNRFTLWASHFKLQKETKRNKNTFIAENPIAYLDRHFINIISSSKNCCRQKGMSREDHDGDLFLPYLREIHHYNDVLSSC